MLRLFFKLELNMEILKDKEIIILFYSYVCYVQCILVYFDEFKFWEFFYIIIFGLQDIYVLILICCFNNELFFYIIGLIGFIS